MKPYNAGFAAFILILSALAVGAQDNPPPADDLGLPEGIYLSTVRDPSKVMPVRVVRDLEMGTEIDRVWSVSSRILERREKALPDAAWKVDPKTTFTPTLIIVKDALRPDHRRVGARLDYEAAALPPNSPDARAAYVLDIDELKHLAEGLRFLNRAISDAIPGVGETVSFQFRSRSGFTVSLTLTPGQEGSNVAAVVGKVSANSKADARRLFEESALMVQKILQQLLAI